MNKIKLIIWTLITLYASLCYGQNSFELSNKVPIDPTIKMGRLSNGLTYYLKQNKKPGNRADLRLVVKVGSTLEDEDQLGLAHFVEHMAFNGTTNFAKNEMIDYLQSVGIEFGADLNAHTSFDETVYKLSVPTDEEDVFDTGLQVLRDWAGGITFDNQEIDNERGIVAEELRARSGARMRMYYQSIPALTNNSRYAERTPIGKLDVILNSEYDAMKRFYRDWYRPDLMALVMVGDFDVDELEKKIKKLFKDLKPLTKKPRERTTYTIPDNTETKVSIVTDEEAPTVSAAFYYKQAHENVVTLEDYKQKVLERLYTGMLRQRLSDIEVTTNSPYLSASTVIGKFLGDKDSYYLRASLEEDKIMKGIEAMLTESERAKRHGFTNSELDRYKALLLNQKNTIRKETGKLSSRFYLEQYIDHFTDNKPIPGDEFDYQFYSHIFPDISVEDINEVAKKWVGNHNIAIVLNAPKKESLELPSEEELVKLLEDVKNKKIEPYKDALASVKLMMEMPQPGTIVETRHNHVIDATTWRFANGVTVIAKPTELQNDIINLGGFRPGGSSVAPDELYVSARNAGTIIGASGINGISATDLKKLNMGKTLRLSSYINFYDDLFRGLSSSENLDRMLQMTHLYFTSPNKDEGVFNNRKAGMIASVKNADKNPDMLFEQKISEAMNQNHLRGVTLTEQQIEEELNLDDTYAFFKERLASANGFTFIFVGNFNLDTLQSYATKYLGSLPSNTNETSNWRDIGLRKPEGIVKETVVKGIGDKSKVDMNFIGTLNFSPKEKRKMVLLAKMLRIKLTEEMREKMAGVYGVQVSGFATDRPYDWYRMSVRFTCAPDNIEVLKETVFEEIEKLKANGPTAEDLEKIKEAELANLKEMQKYNGYWESILKNAHEYGGNPEDALKAEEKIHALTIEEFQEAATTYFNEKNYAEFTLLPEPN